MQFLVTKFWRNSGQSSMLESLINPSKVNKCHNMVMRVSAGAFIDYGSQYHDTSYLCHGTVSKANECWRFFALQVSNIAFFLHNQQKNSSKFHLKGDFFSSFNILLKIHQNVSKIHQQSTMLFSTKNKNVALLKPFLAFICMHCIFTTYWQKFFFVFLFGSSLVVEIGNILLPPGRRQESF